MLSRVVASVAVAGALVSACVPPLDTRPIAEFEGERFIREIRTSGSLIVALPAAVPTLTAPVPGQNDLGEQGFVGEVARWIAAELDVPLQFTTTGTDPRDLVRAGHAHVGFPLVPLTEGRARNNNFADPYFVGHQRLLVPVDPVAPSAADLAGQPVCVAGDDKTTLDLTQLEPTIDLVARYDLDACLRLLERGRVDAATGPDLLLIALAAQLEGYAIVGDALTTEGYAAVVPPGSELADFIDAVIEAAVADGRWERAYDRWLAPYASIAVEPPDLTAEEAAALFPVDVPLNR